MMKRIGERVNLFTSRASRVFSEMILLNILLGIDVTVIPLKFSQLARLPFLRILTTYQPSLQVLRDIFVLPHFCK